MQIQIPDTMTVACKKYGAPVAVPFSTYTPAVIASILQASVQRTINDLVAGAKTDAKAKANVEKKLASWANGEVRATREADPVTAEIKRLITNACKAHGLKGDDLTAQVASEMEGGELFDHFAPIAAENLKAVKSVGLVFKPKA